MRPDWVSPWWQAVALPDSWDVCGVAVPALSVWHTFALENIGNPYMCGGAADKNAAASLLMFARHDYQGGRRLLQMPNHRGRQARRVYRKLRGLSMDDIHAACTEYVQTCQRGVSRWQSGGGKPCAVPYQWHIVYRLSGGDPAKLDGAWNMPYAVARCLCDAAAEQNGDASIMSVAAQEMEDNWDDYKLKAAS